jgi:hypothetical protein
LIALATAAGFVIVGYFVYISRPTACDCIFEQTAPSLSVKVNALKANGEWVIGPEKVQDVSEGVQKIAVHLKSCCISQQSGYIKPEQYQVCVNGAKDYEAKIIQITNIIGEAQAAKQQGNTQLVEQKVAEARTAAAESTSIVSKMAQVVPLPTPSPPADKPSTAALYFLDDFNGKTLEELGDKWEIIRPDADSYALEKDGLLIINSKAGSLADDNIPNLFRLKTAMPEGDWTATVKFSSDVLLGIAPGQRKLDGRHSCSGLSLLSEQLALDLSFVEIARQGRQLAWTADGCKQSRRLEQISFR